MQHVRSFSPGSKAQDLAVKAEAVNEARRQKQFAAGEEIAVENPVKKERQIPHGLLPYFIALRGDAGNRWQYGKKRRSYTIGEVVYSVVESCLSPQPLRC